MGKKGIVVIGLACAVVGYLIGDSTTATKDKEEYDRVTHVANRHEACLRDISGESSSCDTARECQSKISSITTRAGRCFRGLW